MKKIYLLLVIAHMAFLVDAQNNTGIGTTTPNPNALLELDNNGSPLGLLLPRQDISTFTLGLADSGMMVYNTVDDKIYIWNGSAWVSATSEWGVNGTDIFNLNTGNVGIGINTPAYKLTVVENIAGSIAGLNSSGSNTLMDFNNAGVNPANWTFGYLGNTGGNPGFMTFLRGSHRFVVTNNGDVGIAETNPQARLEINSSGNSSASFGLLMSNSSLNPTLSVRDDGHVGIGTSVPDATLTILDNQQLNLQIQSSSTVGTWLSMNNSAGGNWFHMISTGSANGEGPGKLLFHRGSGPLTASGILMTMDHSSLNVGIGSTDPQYKLDVSTSGQVFPIVRIHNIGNNAYNDGGFNTGGLAFHSADITGVGSVSTIAALSQSVGNFSSELSFRTAANGSSATVEHMRITANGYVGIGTSTPQSKFELWENIPTTDGSAGAWMRLKNAAFGTGSISTGIVFSTYNPDGTDKAGIFFRRSQGFGIGDLIFSMNNTFDVSTVNSSNTFARMILTSDGNLGVGSISPTERLVVGGNISAIGLDGDFYASTSNGVINCGGGIMSATINTIADGTPTYNIVNGDEDLYIQDDLEVASQAYKPGGGSWAAISDERMKQNIQPFVDGLTKVLQINPVTYHYNAESGLDQNEQYIGVIAQDVQNILPYSVKTIQKGQIVSEDINGIETIENQGQSILSFDPSSIDYLLINAIKELNTKNIELQRRIEELENQ
ncbi:tail fiber domain-containing protein [Hyphobacterium sp. CCMP332]|nr:tail fiber domain-containing protein [Hyphobacterium sp. CCMP332]